MPSNAEEITPELQRAIDQQFAVQFYNVTKNFGSTLSLGNIKLDIRTGETTALLGSSGSGKTTLLRYINTLHTPSSDAVRVLGQNLNALKKREPCELHKDIGVIFQSFNLVDWMSALENVCTGALGDLKGPRISLFSYPKRVKQEVLEVLDHVGLTDRAHQRVDTFSGGQQQCVAIARAFMQHPKILLVDEPVTALDPVSFNQVVELLEQTSHEDNLIVIFSLYQMQLVVDSMDRIIGLQVGRAKFDHEARGTTAKTAATIYQPVPEATEDITTSASLRAEA